METPLVQAMQSAENRVAWRREVPQRGYASPDEIAGSAVFLLGHEKTSFITGHILNVVGVFAAAEVSAGSPGGRLKLAAS